MKTRFRCMAVVLVAALMLSVQLSSALAAESWPAGGVRVSLDARRLSGADRYATAVAVAREGFPGWAGVTRVVIASGENRALPDAVAAGGLVWAYDAPLLLVQGASVPQSVRTALAEIRAANATMTVTVVGGTAAVSAACAAQVKSIVGTATVERPWAGGDRYSTAAGIALRMKVAADETARTMPPIALAANGTDAAGFYDALALSAVSAKTGAPVLFVKKTAVPPATAAALKALKPSEVIVAGSTAVVSSTVYGALHGSSRLYGADRYATAVEVARAARARAWLDAPSVGVAAAVIDAVTGATVAGRAGAPMLFTEVSRLSKTPAVYLSGVGSVVASATVYGGKAAVSDATFAQLEGSPATPVLVQPTGGKLVAKQAYVKVVTGVNTTQVSLYAGSTLVGTQTVSSFGTADFGKRAMPESGVTFKVIASNPDGRTATKTATYKRLSYPAATSIVIDKSDFKLYWVKGDVLIKAYPIATGGPAWRLLRRYGGSTRSTRRILRASTVRARCVCSEGMLQAAATSMSTPPTESMVRTSHGLSAPRHRMGAYECTTVTCLNCWPQVPLGTIVQTRE